MKKKILGIATALTLAAGLTLVATPAHAIFRASSCANHYLNLVSSNTTCWGGAGYTTVTLYGVYHLIAGNNAGFVQRSSGTLYFTKWWSTSMASCTVAGINIY